MEWLMHNLLTAPSQPLDSHRATTNGAALLQETYSTARTELVQQSGLLFFLSQATGPGTRTPWQALSRYERTARLLVSTAGARRTCPCEVAGGASSR